jgi:uncharacterized membrane protein YfcA
MPFSSLATARHGGHWRLWFWPLAAAMSSTMIAGTWAGKRMIERLRAAHFRLLVAGLFVVTAVQMIVSG